MEAKSRERISIDLQGLKPALLVRSQAQGVSPSELVRKTLELALGVPEEAGEGVDRRPPPKRSGLSPGDHVAGLVAGVPVLLNGGNRSAHITALTTSNAHLSEVSRKIHALTRLLTQADVAQAQVYREMLDTLSKDVRGHLVLCSSALAELRPCRSPTRSGR